MVTERARRGPAFGVADEQCGPLLQYAAKRLIRMTVRARSKHEPIAQHLLSYLQAHDGTS